MEPAEVIIIGAGPAGLHAALELRRRYGLRALVLEREPEAGGAPRWCRHRTFPCRLKRRLFDGPGYARTWLEEALRAGVEIRTATTVLRLDEAGPAVEFTSPLGTGRVEARAVLLATGAREAHRHQRLAAGDRGPGIFTTASVFQSLYVTGQLAQRRFVIFGAEDVSYSCVDALKRAGLEVVAVIEPAPAARSWACVRWYFERLRGVPHYFGIRELEIRGRRGVERVTFRDACGEPVELACDAVVFTGGFTPNAELVREAGLDFNFSTRGPSVNQFFQTSRTGIFAAGNCLRGVVSADEAAAEGRRAARAIHEWLAGRLRAGPEVRVVTAGNVAYCCPDRFRVGGTGRQALAIWPARHERDCVLRITQGGRVLGQKRYGALRPGRRLVVGLAESALLEGAPIEVGLLPAAR